MPYRRRIARRGTLIVYYKDEYWRRTFRNMPGIEPTSVDKRYLLKLAPGGHVGRFVIWDESAFARLNEAI
ncbi:large ribosomal subunit protein uL4-like [Musca autumnalis]|uniref:large ribosomal subunit protein uL4-like n=1 Tax=Musca autumnalis TaxID=221902 RepID=UPI003CF9969F